MAPYGLKALLFRAVELFLRFESGPALEQVASPMLEEKVVLPLQEVQEVRSGGAEDASLAPDKTAGALDGARSLRTGSSAFLSERESDYGDSQVQLRDKVVDMHQ